MRRIVLGILIVLLAALTVATWYAYDKGFTKKWRGFVSEEFRKAGVEVSLRRLTLDPFRGLVAKDVKVFDARDHRRVLAQIDEVNLGINYANVLRRQPFIDFIDLRDTKLALPLDSKNPRGPKIEASRLNARLFLPPQQVYLARAEAELYGVRVSATGRLINPQALAKSENRRPALTDFIARVIEELKALKTEAEPLVLSVQFSGDLSRPEEVSADVRLSGTGVRRQDYRLESLDAALSLRDGTVELQRLRAADARGELHARGSFDPATGKATLQLRSTLDVQELTRALGLAPQLGEFVFHAPPALELTAEGTLDEARRFRALGHVALDRFAFKSVTFESLIADASWDSQRWCVRDARLVHRSGTITGDVLQTSEEFRARIRSTLNPRALIPLLGDRGAAWLADWPPSGAPELTAEFRGPNPRTLSGTMRLLTADTGDVFTIPALRRFPGILDSIAPGIAALGAREASASFTLRDGVIGTDDLRVEGAGFSISGEGRIHPEKDRLDFSMQVRAQPPPSAPTPSAAGFREYVADGKFSEPNWRQKTGR